MTYIVVEEPKIQGLVEIVNTWCEKGFEPLGGITIKDAMFIQAMTIEELPIAEDKETKHDIKDLKIVRFSKQLLDPFTNGFVVEYIYRGEKASTDVESERTNTLDETGLAWLVFDKICNP